MKFRAIYTIAAVCMLTAGCKSKIAIDYNDMIAGKQKDLGKSMDEAEPNLKNYFASYQYDSIAAVSSRMETQIDSIIAQINRKPAPNVTQAVNFKKAALQYFDYMKSIYTSYKDYGLQTTPQGRQVQQQIMSMVLSQEDKEIADMQQAQKIFAKDNGFKILSEKKSQSSSLTASAPGQ
ncbi:MAG TPA: hypothetical protein VGI82_02315 [Chitinophagaceae bacterium]|jgi:hypothetical protein